MSDPSDLPDDRPGAGTEAPHPIRFCGHDTLSLRQLDELNQVPKGTTFRRFKAVRSSLTEGRDFFRLDAAEHAELLERLRAQGRIYPGSVHVVLLTEPGYRRLRQTRASDG
ncbi:MAG: hypothetical protein EA347_06920 [Thioalkalivibrio sp.]|nr:MAG: hypothetical protein EA347_06920 [Thioalkalivibrio sp.]